MATQVDCTRDWAPHGVDRFYNLVRIGFFDDVAFFRVVKQPAPFIVQFGIHGNPNVSKAWIDARLPIKGAYGEDLTSEQEDIQALGNTMLRARYPFLDYIQTTRLIEPAKSGK